jgi:hypothetical protein
MESPKQGLSIKLAPSIYQRLKKEIGKGKINGFIERATLKELDERAKKNNSRKKTISTKTC